MIVHSLSPEGEKPLSFPLTDFHKLKVTTNDHSIFEFVDKGVMYTQTQASLLSQETRKLIREFVKESTKVDVTVKDQVPFGWMGVATKKDGLDYQGSFLKRLSSFLWKEHQVKLDPSLMGKLGNIIGKESSTSGKSFHFRFDPIAQYKDGEFGDAGSCFWQSRPGARSLIRNEGGSFILFFDNPSALLREGMFTVQEGRGHTRAWILPVNQWCDTKEPLFALCNIYSDGTLNKYNVIRAVANQLNMVYKHVDINSQSEMLYVNGNCGYLLGFDPEVMEKASKTPIVFKYKISTYQSFSDPLLPPKPIKCSGCGGYVEYSSAVADEYTRRHGLCLTCYNKSYLVCTKCETEINRTRDIHYRGLCRACANERGYDRCVGCGKWSKGTIPAEGSTYCVSCFNRRFVRCSRCSIPITKHSLVEKSKIDYCENCSTLEERAVTSRCDHCSRRVLTSDLAHTDFNICKSCYYPGKRYFKCNGCSNHYSTGRDHCPKCGLSASSSHVTRVVTPVLPDQPETMELLSRQAVMRMPDTSSLEWNSSGHVVSVAQWHSVYDEEEHDG